jgi:hypothetical protein
MESLCESTKKIIKLIVFAFVSTVIIVAVSFIALVADHYLLGPIFIDSVCSSHINHSQEICDGVTVVVELIIPAFIIILDLLTIWMNKEHILERLEKTLLSS